jgi:hypothetical protein
MRLCAVPNRSYRSDGLLGYLKDSVALEAESVGQHFFNNPVPPKLASANERSTRVPFTTGPCF